jgi:hypothetical protein
LIICVRPPQTPVLFGSRARAILKLARSPNGQMEWFASILPPVPYTKM